MRHALRHLLAHPYADRVIGFVVLLLVALFAYVIVRFAVLRGLRTASKRTSWEWDDALFESGAPREFARMVPPMVVQFGIEFVPDLSRRVETITRNLALALTILYLLRGVGRTVDGIQDYVGRHSRSHVSVRGYLQLLRLLIYAVGAIVIVATLLQRSPWLLLSGLGAASALLLLIFKDTLLGFVASLQIGSNDMLRIGDWIEMPSANADGEVIDIGLHTVKVQNWDGTVSTVPTWRLITESFKNWRAMFESGARRIKRTLAIDSSSIRFLTPDEIRELTTLRHLRDYLTDKDAELRAWNEALGDDAAVAANRRRLTNLGTFRAYAHAYLRAHPGIHPDRTCMVRQMATTGDGIPLELYAFTSNTAWADYERVQSDVFEHLYAILPVFGLGLYQRPAGSDLREGARGGERDAGFAASE